MVASNVAHAIRGQASYGECNLQNSSTMYTVLEEGYMTAKNHYGPRLYGNEAIFRMLLGTSVPGLEGSYS